MSKKDNDHRQSRREEQMKSSYIGPSRSTLLKIVNNFLKKTRIYSSESDLIDYIYTIIIK